MQPAFHLPERIVRAVRARRFGVVDLAVPVLEPDDLAVLARVLRKAGSEAAGTLEQRCAALESAAQRLLDPRGVLRAALEESLPPLTGFSPEMIRRMLAEVLAPIRAETLTRLVSGVARDAFPLIGVVAAGNVPGVALAKMVLALAAGAACLVKTAAGEPLLAALYARALAEGAPELARRAAVLWWPGAEAGWTEALGAAVDSLVAYGSDAAVEALAVHAPRAFVGHGHKLSVAVVRLEDEQAVSRLAEAAATDVSLYDQQGCLSPQTIFAIGSAERRGRFAAALAVALERLARAVPLGSLPEGTGLAVRRLRDEAEWRALGGEPVTLHASGNGPDWTVVLDETGRSWANPLCRSVIVHPLDAVAALGARLGALLPRVASLGIGPWPDEGAARAAAALGIPRAAALGSMQCPDLDWRQGGRHPLCGIVRDL